MPTLWTEWGAIDLLACNFIIILISTAFDSAIKFFSKRSLDLFAYYYLRDSCTTLNQCMGSFGVCSVIVENAKGFRLFNPISLKFGGIQTACWMKNGVFSTHHIVLAKKKKPFSNYQNNIENYKTRALQSRTGICLISAPWPNVRPERWISECEM